MKEYIKKHFYFLLLVFIYFIAELFVRPLGNFPLNDDWSYAQSVLVLLEKGKIDIGDWPAMTLATHILWGGLFTKVFGFSFLVLRISTWVSTFIAMRVLFLIARKISGNEVVSLVLCMTLLYNPVFFNVTNTFMTDVNFLTLLLLSLYFALRFFETERILFFYLTFLMGTALILLRQYGIIVPAAFTLACFFLPKHRTKYVIFGLVLTAMVYGVLLYYESYLRTILSQYSAYKFSGMINPTRRLFWDNLWYGISTRYKIVAIHALFYTFPLTVIFIPAVIRQNKLKLLLPAFVLIYMLVYYLYDGYPLQVGNVFLDTAVGADTSYETLKGTYGDFPHFFSMTFEKIQNALKYLLISVSFTTLIFVIVGKLRSAQKGTAFQPALLLALLFAYLVVILITESFFDRYQVPVIALSLLLWLYICRNYKANLWLAVLPMICWMYVSVFGTRDYFSLNYKKWAAFEQLKKEGVERKKINGGFEIICWNDGKRNEWYDFVLLHKYDYLLQYKKEDSFSVYREYPFRRYFPPKMDTLRVYKRTVFAKGHEPQ